MRISDWSSDVCSSDLLVSPKGRAIGAPASSVPAQRHRGELVAPRRQMPPPNPAGAHQSSAHKTEYACRARGLRSEEHTSELQSLMRISYAVFCLKKKTKKNTPEPETQTKIEQTHI